LLLPPPRLPGIAPLSLRTATATATRRCCVVKWYLGGRTRFFPETRVSDLEFAEEVRN
jgi:hypothetical protein